MYYKSREEALSAAREMVEKRKELAKKGVNHVLVANIEHGPDGYELRGVIVESEGKWHRMSGQYVVMRVEHLKCPVCGRVGTYGGKLVIPGVGSVAQIAGLDASYCVGCHDTMTSQGFLPWEFASDGTTHIIPRPVE